MKKIKICSLFSGVGGFEIGLDKAFGKDRLEVVFASEIDTYANAAYELMHGLKPSGDITAISEENIPPHDVLVAGYPCQSFSSAGRRKGFEDTRGTLFFDIARIAKRLKPKLLLLENVKGLLTHDKGHTFDVMARTLSEIGYKIDFDLINSKHHGVPHNRERVYIVAKLIGEEDTQEKWHLSNLKGSVLHTKKRLLEDSNIKTFNFRFPHKMCEPVALSEILENKVSKAFYLEEEREKEILKRIAETINNEAMNIKSPNHGLLFIAGATDKPNWLDNGKELSRNYKQGSRIYDSRGISSTLSAQGVGGIGGHTGLYLTPDNRIRRLTPLECFRLQGIPDSYYYQLKNATFSNSRLYKMAGNAVTTNVIRDIAFNFHQLIVEEEN